LGIPFGPDAKLNVFDNILKTNSNMTWKKWPTIFENSWRFRKISF